MPKIIDRRKDNKVRLGDVNVGEFAVLEGQLIQVLSKVLIGDKIKKFGAEWPILYISSGQIDIISTEIDVERVDVNIIILNKPTP